MVKRSHIWALRLVWALGLVALAGLSAWTIMDMRGFHAALRDLHEFEPQFRERAAEEAADHALFAQCRAAVSTPQGVECLVDAWPKVQSIPGIYSLALLTQEVMRQHPEDADRLRGLAEEGVQFGRTVLKPRNAPLNQATSAADRAQRESLFFRFHASEEDRNRWSRDSAALEDQILAYAEHAVRGG